MIERELPLQILFNELLSRRDRRKFNMQQAAVFNQSAKRHHEPMGHSPSG